jgi:hypothetical protein
MKSSAAANGTIAVKDGRRVKLYDEHGDRLECPSIEEKLRHVPLETVVIDGEIISLNRESTDCDPESDDRHFAVLCVGPAASEREGHDDAAGGKNANCDCAR